MMKLGNQYLDIATLNRTIQANELSGHLLSNFVSTLTEPTWTKLNDGQRNFIYNTLKKLGIIRSYDSMQQPIEQDDNVNAFFEREAEDVQPIFDGRPVEENERFQILNEVGEAFAVEIDETFEVEAEDVINIAGPGNQNIRIVVQRH